MQGGKFANRFSERIACLWEKKERFAQKNEQFAQKTRDSLKKTSDSLICSFWWATWAIRSHRSFLVSDLSDLLILLIKKEGISQSLVFLTNLQKRKKRTKRYDFSQVAHFLCERKSDERFAQKN